MSRRNSIFSRRIPFSRLNIREGLVLSGSLAMFLVGAFLIWTVLLPIPPIQSLQNRRVFESTKIYDRSGTMLLYDVHGSVRRTIVPLSAMSPYVQNATIAIEDAEFYNHHGIRPLAIVRSIWANISSGSYAQGGSTITQQVVKNTLLTKDKTITRKIKEWILAIRLERLYTKEQIIETYLNETPYGGTVYGVEEASVQFFGVHASELTLAQAAYLAALPKAPTYYSPYGNHRDALEARKDLVLVRMKEHGLITESERVAAASETVTFLDQGGRGIKAPHFVFYVREYLEQKYGADMIDREGLQVISTLDWDLQQKAEKIVRDGALQNEKNFNASNAALVAIDTTNGQILTMVGSRDYFDEYIDGNVNVAVSHRQPGSSFKPFVYATAFELGYTPKTVVFDLKTQFSTACAPSNFSDEPPCYSPENFDNKFRGPITLREALAQSVNIPAVKTLYLSGIQRSIGMAERLGITTLGDPNRYGLTLVLGGGEVTLLEMTGAYGVFANDGVRNPSTPILKVTDRDGTVLEEYKDQSVKVVEPNIARLISDILSDNEARAPEFGADSPLYFRGADVADKTGTTNDYRDVWIIGYTPRISVGAWAGNNDNSPMEKKIAAFIIAPLWHSFMEVAMERYPAGTFPSPEPGPEDLPQVLAGNWNTNPAQGVHEILYWVKKDNPRSGAPTNPQADSQFTHWEYPVSLWAQGIPIVSTADSSNQSGPGVIGNFAIITPTSGAPISLGRPTMITVMVPEGTAHVSYYINGVYLGASNSAPFSIPLIPRVSGSATIDAVAEGVYGTRKTTSSFVSI